MAVMQRTAVPITIYIGNSIAGYGCRGAAGPHKLKALAGGTSARLGGGRASVPRIPVYTRRVLIEDVG
jgi:hypothetical protein